MDIPSSESPEGKKIIKKNLGQDLNGLAQWSDEKRIEAVTSYIALGKMPVVAKATGIPVNTLWTWKKYSNWWTDLEKTVRGEQNNEYSAVITDIVTSTLKSIDDRVKHGDFIYNPRSGDTVRVPVSAKNLNLIAGTLLDKRNKLVRENQADGIVVDEKGLESKLTQLADAFKSFVASKHLPVLEMEEVVREDMHKV
jgi:hypothetical protein